MIGSRTVTHIPCPCGAALEITRTPVGKPWDPVEPNVWKYEEEVLFQHDGEVTPTCIVFKDVVLKAMREDHIRSVERAYATFRSQYLHGL